MITPKKVKQNLNCRDCSMISSMYHSSSEPKFSSITHMKGLRNVFKSNSKGFQIHWPPSHMHAHRHIHTPFEKIIKPKITSH